MIIIGQISTKNLQRLTAGEKGLFKDGKRCTIKVGRRLIVRLSGITYDAAGFVYYLTYGSWPQITLQFLDGDTENLDIKNLVMSKSRTHWYKMREEHDNYVLWVGDKISLPKGSLDNFNKSDLKLAGRNPVTGKRPQGRPRKHKVSTLPEIAGREWRKHKGQWVSTEPAKGVWDDFYLRAEAVLAAGDSRYVIAKVVKPTQEQQQGYQKDIQAQQQEQAKLRQERKLAKEFAAQLEVKAVKPAGSILERQKAAFADCAELLRLRKGNR